MKNNDPICIIGGYDLLSKSFFREIKKKKEKSIFINLNRQEIRNSKIYNFKIFQLRKILDTLKKHKIINILFLGKIERPDVSLFEKDQEIIKYIPLLFESYKKGDGAILKSVIEIFTDKGFNILSPKILLDKFFFVRNEICKTVANIDKTDLIKSINVLNSLSKYDNAQSIVIVKGYIIAIEAAEGTDLLLKRSIQIRKNLNQLKIKAGILTKIPKKNQSKLVDLPVIGPKTIQLAIDANLNGVAVNSKSTMIYNKKKTLSLIKNSELKVYDIS